MIVSFEKEYLKELYEYGRAKGKKYRFQPDIIRRYIRCIDLMINSKDVNSLLQFNSLNYEKLTGNKKGISSVRVNDQYRIEFTECTKENETVATICNIVELSNHYK